MLINPKSLSPVLVMISSMYVPICNRFHIIRANNGKMTSFLVGTPLWRPRSKGTPAPSGTKFCHDKLETLGQPTMNISWSYVALFWYRSRVWQTDRQTPRRWLRHAKHSAVARKNVSNMSDSLLVKQLSIWLFILRTKDWSLVCCFIFLLSNI